MSTFSKISETAWLIKLKFYVEPPWVGERKFVHDMAATPKYVKTSSKIFFSRTNWRIYSKFGMYHLGLQPIIVCSNDEPGMTCFMASTVSSVLETKAFTREKAKTMGILETVLA